MSNGSTPTRVTIPQPDLETQNLEWAVEVWGAPSTYQIEEIRQALSIVRFWHQDRTDLLRRETKGTNLWNDIKHEQELLEVYLTDLKDALWTTAHINKLAGGN